MPKYHSHLGIPGSTSMTELDEVIEIIRGVATADVISSSHRGYEAPDQILITFEEADEWELYQVVHELTDELRSHGFLDPMDTIPRPLEFADAQV